MPQTNLAFNAMVTHVVRQNELALDPDTGSCRYLTANGLKCAVGGLIPAKLYPRGADGVSLISIVNSIRHLYPDLTVELAADVQHAHDQQVHHPAEERIKRFIDATVEIAARYDITYPYLEVELLVVRNQLATEDGQKRFEFNTFSPDTTCGCIAGFVQANGRFKTRLHGVGGCTMIAKRLSPEDISKELALSNLFGVHNFGFRHQEVTTEMAIKAIDNFLATGSAKWEEIFDELA